MPQKREAMKMAKPRTKNLKPDKIIDKKSIKSLFVFSMYARWLARVFVSSQSKIIKVMVRVIESVLNS